MDARGAHAEFRSRGLFQGLFDFLGGYIQCLFGADLSGETARDLVSQDLLGSIGFRAAYPPHFTLGGDVVGVLQRLVDGPEPGFGWLAVAGMPRTPPAPRFCC